MTPNPRSLAVIGDSITEIGGLTNVNPNLYLGTGFWTQAQFLLYHAFTIATDAGIGLPSGNLGVGGQNSTQIAARFSDVVNLNPAYVHILAGTNDTDAKGVPVAQSIANVDYMIQTALAHGITPIVGTVPANNGGITNGTFGNLRQLNDWIRAQAAVRGVIVVDYFAATVNPATANYATGPTPNDNWTVDGTHPAPSGAYQMAKALVAALKAAGVPLSPAPMFADELDTRNALLYSQFTAGTAGAAPTGWNGSTPANSGTVTYSRVARTDLPARNWFQILLAPSTAGATTGMTFTNVNHRPSAWAIGDQVVGSMEINLSALEQAPATSYQRGATLSLQARNSGGTTIANSNDLDWANGSTSYPNHSPESRIGLFRTPPMTIPAGTTTLALVLTLGSGGTFQLDRSGIHNLSRWNLAA